MLFFCWGGLSLRSGVRARWMIVGPDSFLLRVPSSTIRWYSPVVESEVVWIRCWHCGWIVLGWWFRVAWCSQSVVVIVVLWLCSYGLFIRSMLPDWGSYVRVRCWFVRLILWVVDDVLGLQWGNRWGVWLRKIVRKSMLGVFLFIVWPIRVRCPWSWVCFIVWWFVHSLMKIIYPSDPLPTRTFSSLFLIIVSCSRVSSLDFGFMRCFVVFVVIGIRLCVWGCWGLFHGLWLWIVVVGFCCCFEWPRVWGFWFICFWMIFPHSIAIIQVIVCLTMFPLSLCWFSSSPMLSISPLFVPPSASV